MTEKDLLNTAAEDANNGCTPPAKDKDDLKKASVPTKVFSHRNSVLTDLMELNHVQTVYNISVAVCILLGINAVIYYLTTPQQFLLDLQRMQWGVSKLHVFLIVWLCLNLLCHAVHQSLCLWARYRHKFSWKILDSAFLLFVVAVVVTMFTVTPHVVLKYEIPPITAFALLAEQVRMFMKIYSLVRENYPRIKKYNFEKDGDQLRNLYPSVSHFTFYMFAPVLVYRDTYPRTEKIRWSFVLTSFLKVIACIFIAYCVFVRFIVDIFQNIGLKPYRLEHLALIFAGCMVVGSMIMFLIFYAVIHSWLNAFAEMLRFGDRLFYKDWWNSTSFLQYYRMWNGVVYDWLYTYVYVDVHKMGVSRQLSRLNVFVISAIAHDYIICFALGYFFPALGVVYCTVGVTLMFLTNRKTSSSWNTFMWVFLFAGWGLLIFMYAAEWYSRKNCPVTPDGAAFYLPRSFSCLKIDYS